MTSERQLLEAAYRSFQALLRGGCDWDLWAQAGAQQAMDDLGDYLWPNPPPVLLLNDGRYHVHPGDLEETLVRLAEIGLVDTDAYHRRWLTPTGLLAARALLALLGLTLRDSNYPGPAALMGDTIGVLNLLVVPERPAPPVPDHPPEA